MFHACTLARRGAPREHSQRRTRLGVKHKLKTASSVCDRAALTRLSMTPSTPTHQPRRFRAQICRNHNSRRGPSHPRPPRLGLFGGRRSGVPLFMSISCFFFCWRSCFSRSAFSFASLALLIFSSISLFLWFSFTAS